MITSNFSRDEFECHCGCGFSDPHPALVMALQELRDTISRLIFISSGSRCVKHNADAGGSPRSFHLPQRLFDDYSCAADIIVPSMPLMQLHDIVMTIPVLKMSGIGVYVDANPRLHVDVRAITHEYGTSRWAQIDGEPAQIENALQVEAARRRSK